MRRTCDIDGMSSTRGGIFINVNKTSDNRATLIRRRLVCSGRSCVVSAFGVNGRTSQFDAAEIAREINCISTADRLEYMHGNRSPRCLGYTASQDHQRRFRAGADGHRPLQIVASPPPNLAVLLTHCGQLLLRKKFSKFDATRCPISRLR